MGLKRRLVKAVVVQFGYWKAAVIIPPKPSLLQPGQVCFPQPFLTGQMLQHLEPSRWSSAERFSCVLSSLSSGNLVKISMT